MTIYTPYTYLIGWTKLNKWYYGSRYAKKSHPKDLWTTYFTSSKHVKKFRDLHGDPDSIQIRKVFTDAQSARLWEERVLRKLDVIHSDIWLNKTNNKGIDPTVKRNTIPGSKAAAEKRKGKTFEELFGIEKAKELKDLTSRIAKSNWSDPKLAERMKRKPSDTSRYKEAAIKRWANKEDSEKRKQSMSKSAKSRVKTSLRNAEGKFTVNHLPRTDHVR